MSRSFESFCALAEISSNVRFENCAVIQSEGEKAFQFSLKPLRPTTKYAQTRAMQNHDDMMSSLPWAEDLGGLSFDELRDLPYQVQANLDTSVFE